MSNWPPGLSQDWSQYNQDKYYVEFGNADVIGCSMSVSHVEAFEESQFIVYVQDGVSAVDHIEGTFGERPLSGISHLKLDLMYSISLQRLKDELICGV